MDNFNKSLIDILDEPSVWQSFLLYKTEREHFSRREEAALVNFINSVGYLPCTERLKQGLGFDYPKKHLINKLNGNKKRIVYSFTDEENQVLKLLAYLLYKYDDKQSSGCYSFRRNFGAHVAIKSILATPNIEKMWCYKTDISDYFNSIKIPLLLPILRDIIGEDLKLYNFFEQILTSDFSFYEGKLIKEKRGVMAGTPISPFLANIYLRELDDIFANMVYARYSDDIIVFAESQEDLKLYKQKISEIITEYGLTLNHKKEYVSMPGESWEFLGVSFKNGTIDLSIATRQKIKGKIRRKARALRRWMLYKNAEIERAMKAMIRAFNKKFYDKGESSDLTWSRWFFPLLTDTCGLKEIDNYLQQYIRYIPCGGFKKANYRIDYKKLKECGYRSLVNEYYKGGSVKN